ncbi:MAG: hypothetical protein IEMM0008_0552 [bacterium]|nr:MAG: hypothetical protein IEMM0008_0552 [bacterium]
MKPFFTGLLLFIIITISCRTDSQNDHLKKLVSSIDALPGWVKNVVSVHVKTLLADPVLSSLIRGSSFFTMIQNLKKDAGIDIHRIVAGVADMDSQKKEKPHIVLFIEANYNTQRTLKYIKDKAKKNKEEIIVEKSSGFIVLTSKKYRRQFKVALIHGKSILIASAPKMDEVLERIRETSDSSKRKAIGFKSQKERKLKDLIGSVQKDHVLWGVFRLSDTTKSALGKWIKPTHPVHKINTLTIALRRKQNTVLTLKAVAQDKTSAQVLMSFLETKRTGKLPFYLKLLFHKAKITRSENTIRVQLTLNNIEFKEIVRLLSSRKIFG